MRLRVWDHFGDARAVVEMRELSHLLRLRLPASALLALARAFHRYYLAQHEEAGALGDSKSAYHASVGPLLGGLLLGLRPEQGVEARRLLAYRAAERGDAASGRALAEAFPDDPVLAALTPPPEAAPELPAVSEEDQFYAAWRLQDWGEVQRLGRRLLATHPHLAPVLERSLIDRPNPELRAQLRSAAPGAEALAPSPPQTWAEWFSALATGDERQLEQFLKARDEAALSGATLTDLTPLQERLSEVFTAPKGTYAQSRVQILIAGLTQLIGECVSERTFPASSHLELYMVLSQCWGEWKGGSAYPPDGQILLTLADAALQLDPRKEGELAGLVERWWKARPAQALLPFMLAGVELFHRLGTSGHAEQFWVLAGEFVRRRVQLLTPGERLLWRQVGRDIGYDDSTLDEYVPQPATTGPEADPIREAGVSKIAVVSTREEQAERAAAILRDRANAEVVVVTATSGGHETKSAATADVIAYVWSASTHAVYRAFDKVDRRKIAYVRGTGVASIVMAVERWAFENRAAPEE
jgi:hypothetical protein